MSDIIVYRYNDPKYPNKKGYQMSILSDGIKHDYQNYFAQYKQTLNSIKPVNTSGRSKAQIVADMESTTLKKFLVDDVPFHILDCKCMECFDTYWSKIKSTTDEAL